MNALTIAHLSDLHLPFDPQLSRRQRVSKRQLSVWSWRRRRLVQRPEILEALVRDLAAHAPDHIVITGDITNFSLPDEFRRAAAWLHALAPAERISLVPGNHDALVSVAPVDGMERWRPWTRADAGWPFTHRRDDVAFIGLNSALPTAPLLATGRLGAEQLSRLESVLLAEAAAGRTRVVLLHHPVAEHAVSRRKALADRQQLRKVLSRAGAELVLHGHARDARLDCVQGPRGPIPCLCVPSSSALPNAQDEGARWHRVRLPGVGEPPLADVLVRKWDLGEERFVDAVRYQLRLPERSGLPNTQAAALTLECRPCSP
ncbi:MAG: metallophosphoesterase [Steroidobacteraceae bacterium]